MNSIPNNIHNILGQWGRSQQALPVRNGTLKSEILARLSPASPAEVTRTTVRIPWLPVLFTGLAVVTFILSVDTKRILPPVAYPVAYLEKSSSPAVQQYDSAQGNALSNAFSSQPMPPVPNEIPSTDNREFLKTSYNASIKTRHVRELTGRLQTIVRGFGGRVDSVTSSPDNGYLNFVVPASQFEVFRSEAKSLVGARFYTEQTGSENLLPQKRSIEEQQTAAQQTLTQLQASRAQMVTNHNNMAANWQSQIDSATRQLAAVQAEMANHPERKTELEPQQRQLQSQINGLKNRLAIENSNYSTQLNGLDGQIQNANATLKNLSDQNNALLDNVATVSGSISLSHINPWGIINLYVPAYWISLIFLGAAIAAYFIQHRRSQIILP